MELISVALHAKARKTTRLLSHNLSEQLLNLKDMCAVHSPLLDLEKNALILAKHCFGEEKTDFVSSNHFKQNVI